LDAVIEALSELDHIRHHAESAFDVLVEVRNFLDKE